MQVKLLSITPNAQKLLTQAGRVCYRSDKKGEYPTFLRDIIGAGHESVLEHASATFKVSGISRACSHQLVRHRLASFSQESQRYVESSNFYAVIPSTIDANQEASDIFWHVMDVITEAYDELRELGIPREDARFVLPNATATRIVVTMNFRELRHVFHVRLSEFAQWEIREVCRMMLVILKKHVPEVFFDFEEEI